MSASCLATCSHCGSKRHLLSDTLSLQLDDGRLVCLRHPAETYDCERHGLTLNHASERGRLFRETFFICRHCGKNGETIHRQQWNDSETFTVRGAMKWGWGSAVVIVPLLAWMHWWQATVVVGATLLLSPAIYWNENRKINNALAARGLPAPNAPGRTPIPPPSVGCVDGVIVGRRISASNARGQASGPCCDQPDWIDAFTARDADRVPCAVCGQGVMINSDHAIH